MKCNDFGLRMRNIVFNLMSAPPPLDVAHPSPSDNNGCHCRGVVVFNDAYCQHPAGKDCTVLA